MDTTGPSDDHNDENALRRQLHRAAETDAVPSGMRGQLVNFAASAHAGRSRGSWWPGLATGVAVAAVIGVVAIPVALSHPGAGAPASAAAGADTSGGKSATDKTAADKSAADKSAANKSAADKSAANPSSAELTAGVTAETSIPPDGSVGKPLDPPSSDPNAVTSAPVPGDGWGSSIQCPGSDKSEAVALPEPADVTDGKICLSMTSRLVDGDGLWQGTPVARVDGTELAALARSLKAKDEQPTDGSCTMELWLAPDILLSWTAGGQTVTAQRVHVPIDGCSKPQKAFRDALDSISPASYSFVKDQRIISEAAVQAGCDGATAGKFVGDGSGTKVGTLPAKPKSELGVCLMAGNDDIGYTLTAVGALDAGARDVLWASKLEAVPAGCRPATGAATVQVPGYTNSDRGKEFTPKHVLQAELDGCRRVMDYTTGEIVGALSPDEAAALKDQAGTPEN